MTNTKHQHIPPSAQKAVVPLFALEFASVTPKSDDQRLAEYRAKRNKAGIKPQESEMTKVFSLLMQISDNFAAEADAVIDWDHREVVITIDGGGKTIYAATVQIDSDAIEARFRLIRHEIEQMKIAALAGRMGVAS